MTTTKKPAVTVKAALRASGLTPTQAAVKANIGVTTVYIALRKNRWPVHGVVSDSLKRALGIEVTSLP